VAWRRGIDRLWLLDHARAARIRSGISANWYVTISIGLKSNGANTLHGDLIVALAFESNDPDIIPEWTPLLLISTVQTTSDDTYTFFYPELSRCSSAVLHGGRTPETGELATPRF
jgi:hypothetical protein